MKAMNEHNFHCQLSVLNTNKTPEMDFSVMASRSMGKIFAFLLARLTFPAMAQIHGQGVC